MRRFQTWSIEEDDRLRDLVARDVDRKDIADQLGRTREAISVRMSRLGLLKAQSP